MTQIHLLTTCTNSKHKSSECAQLSQIPTKKCIFQVTQHWLEKLAQIPNSNKLSAINRYKGGHWSLAKKCSEIPGVDLHVLSAGLGLIHQTTPIPDYQATFASNSPNTVPTLDFPRRRAHQQWWQALCQHSDKSIRQLMAQSSRQLFVVVGSKDYIGAISSDLQQGVAMLVDPSRQLLIVTSGTEHWGELEPYLVRSQSSMVTALKANMTTLNIALGQKILQWLTNGLTFQQIRTEKIPTLIGESIKPQTFRVRRTESEVEQYVISALRQNPSLSPSKALRLFRNDGNSYEEKRFKAIFSRVVGAYR